MTITNTSLPQLKTLTDCVNKLAADGYTTNFKATEEGLLGIETEEIFKPEEVKISNFFRFEGMNDPDDNSILYAIETASGLKGTLVDAYGTYADPVIDEFIKAVENISKKNATANSY